MAYVTLTRGLVAVIDSADVPLIDGHNWRVLSGTRTSYASRAAPRSKDDPRQSAICMHRLLTDAPEGMEVDHIDGDGLNNRRSNLRIATKSQNQHNARLSAANKSGAKGVFRSRNNKWTSQIRVGGHLRHLGTYSTRDEAAAAYAKASAELHGEFGRLACA